MKLIKRVLHFGLLFLLAGCNEPVNTVGPGPGGSKNNNNFPDWGIPKNEVFDGGPGKDGIPALEKPSMISAAEAKYLTDNSLVVGIKDGDDIRAYPHPILDWHEIINDNVGSSEIAIIYCPLTGTATVWDRFVNGTVTTFGVSGLLYNSNVIPYDRSTGSNWSQIRLRCVNGSLQGRRAVTLHAVETTWKTWKTMFPDTKVVSAETGYSRSYDRYPYGDYRTNNDQLLFPYSPHDIRIPTKERVLGVVATFDPPKAKVYRFENFVDPLQVEQDTFEGIHLVIAGSKAHNFLVVFERRAEDGATLEFSAVDFGQGASASILKDTEGNIWNIMGEAVSGPRTGQKLIPVVSFIGYWFSWGAFYPNAEIFE